jgi:hypothetical protein
MYFIGTTKYRVGVPIVESFSNPSEYYDFFTQNIVYWIYLGAGFKGGEVTPFFFGPHWEAPYPFCPITYCAFWQEWDLWLFFQGPLIALSPARLWAWNSLEWKADYLSVPVL